MKDNLKSNIEFSAIIQGAAVVAGIAIVFFASISSLSLQLKAGIAVGVLAAGVLMIFFAVAGNDPAEAPTSDEDAAAHGGVIEDELSVLEEAAVFFSASIKQDEMLRLLEARLGSTLSGCTARIFRLTRAGMLDAPHVGRSESIKEIPARIALVTDTAAEAASTRGVVRSEDLFRENDIKKKFSRVAAIALRRADEVFCVLTFSCPMNGKLPSDETVYAVAERITPLISGSVSFESSIANALRDSLTDLPNERAMYLLLENQVAEAQRFGSTRPLTVIAIDIRSFEEINKRFGHSTGDRLLVFVGRIIKDQLRKMDLLARTGDDEFIIVLPTADINSSKNVIERVDGSFKQNKFELPDGMEHPVELNYGRASFGDDGDTASKIVRQAIERKQIEKSAEKGSVIRFPSEKPKGNR